MQKKINYSFILLILFGFIFPIFAQTVTNPDIVVAKDGSGKFQTVQEAINSVPDGNSKWVVIFVKAGTYKEKIKVEATKTFIRLVGENALTTILTYDDCNSTAKGTAASASFTNYATDFIAENITFENAFDYDNSDLPNKQGVALLANADRQIYLNCRMLGHQDTLFVRSGRQYFKNCYIEGHTDFIFGDATSVFENCQIHSLFKPGASVTAASTLEATKYGLIFINCNLTADSKFSSYPGTVFLGRPWHPSSVKQPVKSNAVFLNCTIGAHINKDGWTNMSGNYPKTERMWEFKNKGEGVQKSKERKQLTARQAKEYVLSNIFGVNENYKESWDPLKFIK